MYEQYKIKKFNGTIDYRPDTTDMPCIIEVIENKVYSYKKHNIVFEPNSQQDKLWLDLGANIGTFTKLIELCGGKCISFEPIKENYELLERNAKHSDCYNTAVTTHKEETLQFYTATKPNDLYRFTECKNARPYCEVDNMHISELIDMEFHGIKMDIEGSELSIIDQRLIPKCQILVMEYHFSRDKSMVNFHNRIAILEEMFEIVQYQPFLNKYDLDKPYPISQDKMIHAVGWKK